MTQYRKNKVKESIDAAALAVFAKKGFISAKIADISRLSGVSVGNIYRYYKNKEEIFYSVVPENFAEQMLAAISDKIGAVKTMNKSSTAAEEAAEGFLSFIVDNRNLILILFAGSGGTRMEKTKPDMAGAMLGAVKLQYPEAYEDYINKHGDDRVLRIIYENLIDVYSKLMRMEYKDKELYSRLKQANLYHFSGIMRLMNIEEV